MQSAVRASVTNVRSTEDDDRSGAGRTPVCSSLINVVVQYLSTRLTSLTRLTNRRCDECDVYIVYSIIENLPTLQVTIQ